MIKDLQKREMIKKRLTMSNKTTEDSGAIHKT